MRIKGIPNYLPMDYSLQLDIKEKDFIQACIEGESWAQQKIYEDHYSMMLPVCMRYADDDNEALDILHDGFIKVFKNISKYKSGTSLKAWIKRVIVNTAIDLYRKKVRRRTEDLDNVYDAKNLDPDVVSEMAAEEIIKGLQTLSPVYRTVFNMYVIEGYPHKEIAAHLGITESTSRSNLVKARAKLKSMFNRR